MKSEKADAIFCHHQWNQSQLMELRSNHGFDSRISKKCYQFFNRIETSITLTVTIVIHKSRNLIVTLGSSQFGPK